MAQGFIHDELDVKLLVLYIMSRVSEPVDFATLTDLALCDSGVDYFLFAQAVSGLVESRHLALTDGLYTVTDKGMENARTLEEGLPSVVRGRCDRALQKLNATLRRARAVTGQVTEGENGHLQVELELSDETGRLLRLALAVPNRELGERIVENFRKTPEDLFNRTVALLLAGEEG